MTVRRLQGCEEPSNSMRTKLAYIIICAAALAACSTSGDQSEATTGGSSSEVVVRPTAPQSVDIAPSDQANIPQYQPSAPVLSVPVDPDQISLSCAEELAPARDIYSKWLAGVQTSKAELDRAASIVDSSTKICTQTDLYLFQKEMFPQMLTTTTVK